MGLIGRSGEGIFNSCHQQSIPNLILRTNTLRGHIIVNLLVFAIILRVINDLTKLLDLVGCLEAESYESWMWKQMLLKRLEDGKA